MADIDALRRRLRPILRKRRGAIPPDDIKRSYLMVLEEMAWERMPDEPDQAALAKFTRALKAPTVAAMVQTLAWDRMVRRVEGFDNDEEG